jgi:hypothetical protein
MRYATPFRAIDVDPFQRKSLPLPKALPIVAWTGLFKVASMASRTVSKIHRVSETPLGETSSRSASPLAGYPVMA